MRPKIMGEGDRVCLRAPEADDAERFIAAVARSRELHRPWVSPPADRASFEAYLGRVADPRMIGALVVSREPRDAGQLVGVINASEIVRGCFQSAYLGFYAFVGAAGRGLMTEGLALFCAHAFEDEQLHRLEANIQPDNARSLALAQRLGFSREGFSPRYLKIDGDWRDHERWALLVEDWRAARGARRERELGG